MAWLTDPQAWIALATLTVLEIVLGIDNIIFITILVSRLPSAQRQKARIIGLALAMINRIALLLSIVWVMTLTKPLFTFMSWEFSGRDLILIEEDGRKPDWAGVSRITYRSGKRDKFSPQGKYFRTQLKDDKTATDIKKKTVPAWDGVFAPLPVRHHTAC